MREKTEQENGREVDALLGDRFSVERLLGRGAQGRTYLGQDRQSGEAVAIKELDLGQADDWKAIELFEREAQALQSLNYPNIPRYVDAFHRSDQEGRERFFLVQQFVEGSPLEKLIERGASWSEGEARRLLRQLLEILVYLQDRSPRVIHRDIKPSNLILGSNGRLSLIDFGAVQAVMPVAGSGGSTVVGTTGYMPVEQIMGRAGPASDLYAVGATMVHLLSGHHPAQLPLTANRLDFRGLVNVSDRFAGFLEWLLHPHVEERPADARQALRALDDLDRPAPARAAPVAVPVQSSADNVVPAGPIFAMVGVFIVVLFVGLLVPITNCGRFTAKMYGYEDLVMEPLYTCKIVEEVLGEDPRIRILGMQDGGTGSGDGSGHARWRLPVKGSEATGTYRYVAFMTRGQWELRTSNLTVDGVRYELDGCERREESASTP